MEKRLLLLMLCMLFSLSCKKTSEQIVDCFGESLFTGVHIKTDGSNSKLVHLEVKYSGSHTVTSVFWDYGDGSSATTSEKTSDHTYASAGVYELKVKITIVRGKSTCETSPVKSITIN